MSEISFARFIQLVEFDQATDRLAKETRHLEEACDKDEGRIATLTSELQIAEERMRKARLLVKEKEAHMESLDDQQRTKERQLERINNPREYTSLQHEIDNLKKAQHTFEPELLQVWHEAEKETAALKSLQERSDREISHLYEEIKNRHSTLQNLLKQIEERTKEREQFLVGVPPELLEKYDALRPRMKNPIVPIAQNACSVCAQVVPAQQLNRLRLHALEQCKNCFRFLYDPGTI